MKSKKEAIGLQEASQPMDHPHEDLIWLLVTATLLKNFLLSFVIYF